MSPAQGKATPKASRGAPARGLFEPVQVRVNSHPHHDTLAIQDPDVRPVGQPLEFQETEMKRLMRSLHRTGNKQKGLMGYVLAWILGVPIPILIIVALLRSCA